MSATSFPHERRLQRYASLALAGAVGLGAWLILQGEPRVGAYEIPALAPWALLVVGAVATLVGTLRRATWLAILGAAILALAVVPASQPRPDALGYGLGLAFGAFLLCAGELVHMMERYQKAHRAVESENVPEEHINRVTDESLRTLALRAGLSVLACGAAVGLAYALSAIGPRQWRAAAETTAPLGVALAALALAGLVSLSILARGASLRREDAQPKEVLPDVAE